MELIIAAIVVIIFVVFINKKANSIKSKQKISGGNNNMQTSKRGIPLRWFDLITSIFAAFYIYKAATNSYSGMSVEELGFVIAYIIIIFALRRFFYNKEK